MKIIGFTLNVAVISTTIFICNMPQADADPQMVHAYELSKYVDKMTSEFKKERIAALSEDIKALDRQLTIQHDIKNIESGIAAAVTNHDVKLKPYIVMQFFDYNNDIRDDGWVEVDRFASIEEARAVRDNIVRKLRSVGSDEAVTIHVEVL